MKLNINKCMVLRIAIREVEAQYKYTLKSADNTEQLKETSAVRDLGVMVDSRLSFKEHIQG